MKLFQYDNRFFRLMGYLWDLSIINILWILFSVPLITIGASTCAMVQVVWDMQNACEGSSIVKSFLWAFRKHLGRGTAATVIVSSAILVVGVNLNYWSHQNGSAALVCTVLSMTALLYLFFTVLYLGPVIVRGRAPVLKSCVQAFLLAVQKLPLTLMTLIMLASLWYIAKQAEGAALAFLLLGGTGTCHFLCYFLDQGNDRKKILLEE